MMGLEVKQKPYQTLKGRGEKQHLGGKVGKKHQK